MVKGRGRQAPPKPGKAPKPASRSQASERGPAPPLSARASPESALPHEGGEDESALILLGEFGRAHGLRGEVRLKSFTAEPAAIATYGPLVGEDGRRFVLMGVRPAGGAPDMLVARVEGVATREAAESLNRLRLHAPRDRLPPPEEDEFFAADLIGLAVETAAGEVLGTVVAVPDYGGGDLLEIAPIKGGRTALLPFTKAFVPAVDLAGRRVVVDPPDDLFEGAPDGRRP